jgi:methionine synthase II (cobalamin-independent)
MPRYRADQVGSFLRPPDLLAARVRADSDPEGLRALEDRHIRRVLARQEELGFEIFTDGELRRRNFMSDFTDAVEGFDFGDEVARTWQAGGTAAPASVSHVAGIVNRKLRAVRGLTGHELAFLKAHAPGDIKMTLPSATQFPAIAFKRGVTDRVYPDHSALLWDIVDIMKTELAALAAGGVAYIQIDAPRYSYFVDPKWREWIRTEMRLEPAALLDESIRADNACLDAARRAGITLAIHLCRGNNRSHWYAQGGYDAIAEKLFTTMKVDRFLLEYDDDRSGTFEPLRFVPRGKTVVLGLVSSKRPLLESADELARRVDEASRYVALEDLAVSPQCGFASTMEGNLLTEDEQWAKLGLVAQTVRNVWGYVHPAAPQEITAMISRGDSRPDHGRGLGREPAPGRVQGDRPPGNRGSEDQAEGPGRRLPKDRHPLE